MRRAALFLCALLAFVECRAWPGRSAQAVAEFRKANPCPATGKAKGACKGWEIDHITPLKCGGPDTAANMQWLTVAEHKLKTKREAMLCRTLRNSQRIA